MAGLAPEAKHQRGGLGPGPLLGVLGLGPIPASGSTLLGLGAAAAPALASSTSLDSQSHLPLGMLPSGALPGMSHPGLLAMGSAGLPSTANGGMAAMGSGTLQLPPGVSILGSSGVLPTPQQQQQQQQSPLDLAQLSLQNGLAGAANSSWQGLGGVGGCGGGSGDGCGGANSTGTAVAAATERQSDGKEGEGGEGEQPRRRISKKKQESNKVAQQRYRWAGCARQYGRCGLACRGAGCAACCPTAATSEQHSHHVLPQSMSAGLGRRLHAGAH